MTTGAAALSKKTPRFDVRDITIVNAGSLKALATVRVDTGITINEIKVIQNGTQVPWVSLPQKSWVDTQGQRRWSTLIEFREREWRDALTAAVVKAWQDHPEGFREIAPVTPAATALGREAKARIGGTTR